MDQRFAIESVGPCAHTSGQQFCCSGCKLDVLCFVSVRDLPSATHPRQPPLYLSLWDFHIPFGELLIQFVCCVALLSCSIAARACSNGQYDAMMSASASSLLRNKSLKVMRTDITFYNVARRPAFCVSATVPFPELICKISSRTYRTSLSHRGFDRGPCTASIVVGQSTTNEKFGGQSAF